MSQILLAVSVVGKNINRKGQAIWVLNENVAIDSNGQTVRPEDYHVTWLGSLIKDKTSVLKDSHKRWITTPIGTVHFDIL